MTVNTKSWVLMSPYSSSDCLPRQLADQITERADRKALPVLLSEKGCITSQNIMELDDCQGISSC